MDMEGTGRGGSVVVGGRGGFKRELEDWEGSDEEESEEEEDEEDSDDSEDDEGEGAGTPATSVVMEDLPAASELPEEGIQDETEEVESQSSGDKLPHPRPFEALRDFFSRTSTEWQDAVLEAMKYERDPPEQSVKEIRKRAFDRAERKWYVKMTILVVISIN